MRTCTTRRRSVYLSRRIRLWFAVPALAWAVGATASVAEAQMVRPSIGRYRAERAPWNSGASIENRYLDRQAEPRFEERRTHLGWEVRGRTYIVMANSSRDDAQLAARTIEATWGDTLRMADYWTERHRDPNFSVAAISVHIDQNPRRERQEGDLRFVNNRTHIYLNVAEGEPAAEEQLGKLRASTVHAFWRRSELDLELPTWVRSGLANYIATQQALAQGDTAPAAMGGGTNVYDPYWTRGRIGRHELAPPEPADELAGLRIRYLLEGDDARYAPAFFAALASTGERPATPFGASSTRNYQPNDAQQTDTPIDRLYTQVSHGLNEWLSNPMVDQPQIVPLENAPQLSEQQQQMAFLLKLAKRRGDFSTSGVKMKIIGGDAPAAKEQPVKTVALNALFAEATAANTPLWATLDPHGNLLLSDQTDRLRELFEPRWGAYRSVEHNGRWAIETRIDRNTRLVAWLEDNPDVPRQPLAKFELITDSGHTTSEPSKP